MCPPDADRRCSSARRLREEERAAILACLHEERFQDGSPAQVYASWLDEGQYHCSLRTMYRLLAAEGENRERRDQWRRPPDAKPELLATAPHPRWSWDMTKRRGPAQWTFYDLYLILDVFSRSVTGCMIAYRESADWAQQLIEESYEKQKMVPGQRTVHADRGSSMTSQSVALLRSDLGGVKTHSRPYVSADHPYAEAPFKTLKYRPGFPDRFSSLAAARGFCQEFFPWYNHEHHPAGLNWMTPATVHYGLAEKRISASQSVLDAAYQAHPERFVKRPPQHPSLPEAVWINPPAAKQDKTP
jgi:putative transposase